MSDTLVGEKLPGKKTLAKKPKENNDEAVAAAAAAAGKEELTKQQPRLKKVEGENPFSAAALEAVVRYEASSPKKYFAGRNKFDFANRVQSFHSEQWWSEAPSNFGGVPSHDITNATNSKNVRTTLGMRVQGMSPFSKSLLAPTRDEALNR